MGTNLELARRPKPSGLCPSVKWRWSYLPHSTRRSGSQDQLPETGRSGLALLLEPGHGSRSRAFAEKISLWKAFNNLVSFPERSGLLLSGVRRRPPIRDQFGGRRCSMGIEV